MPVCAVNYYSRSLGMSADMQVLAPEGDGPFGVVYLLHGLGGDHTTAHVGETLDFAEEHLRERR
jgi:hypothetical protein